MFMRKLPTHPMTGTGQGTPLRTVLGRPLSTSEGRDPDGFGSDTRGGPPARWEGSGREVGVFGAPTVPERWGHPEFKVPYV